MTTKAERLHDEVGSALAQAGLTWQDVGRVWDVQEGSDVTLASLVRAASDPSRLTCTVSQPRGCDIQVVLSLDTWVQLVKRTLFQAIHGHP